MRKPCMSSAWDKDRFMSPDIDAVTGMLQDEKIWQVVRNHVEEYNETQVSPSLRFLSYLSHPYYLIALSSASSEG